VGGLAPAIQKFLAPVVTESWCSTGVIPEHFALELLRSPGIRTCCADRGGCLDSVEPVPPLIPVPPVLVDEALDVLEVAPLLACLVSRFAIAVDLAKLVSEDLTLALTKAVFNGERSRSPDPNLHSGHHANSC